MSLAAPARNYLIGESWAGATVLLFGAAYVLGAAFGQWLAIIPGIGITLWPPSGLFIASLIVAPRPIRPLLVITGLCAELVSNHLWFHNSIWLAVPIYAGNAIEALVAAAVVRSSSMRPGDLESPRDVLLLGVAVAVGALFSASIGSSMLAAAEKQTFVSAFPLWWLGDITGALVFTPPIMVALQSWRVRADLRASRLAEIAALGVLLAALSALSLGGLLPFAYLVTPALLWAAIRFEVKGAMAMICIITVLTSALTVAGISPFMESPGTPKQQHVMLQLFLAVSAVSALVVAVLSRQHRLAMVELKQFAGDLEARISERTAMLRESEERFRKMADHAPVMVWMTEPSGSCSFLSKSWYETTGQTPRTGLGTGWLNAIHPEDRSAVERKFTSANSARQPFRLEYRLRQANGSYRWVLDAAAPRFGPNEEFLGHIGSVIDIEERRTHENQVQLLLEEVNHRSKNMLSLIMALARQTVKNSSDNFLDRFQRRIQSLAASQDLLVKNEWRSVLLEDLIRSQLAHLGSDVDRRIKLQGPELQLNPKACQTLGMALHELATNAMKYGALSNDAGYVDIAWAVSDPDGQAGTFAMMWRELDGPVVTTPDGKGFGTTVVRDMVNASLNGQAELRFSETGMTWRLSCPVERVSVTASSEAVHPKLRDLSSV